MPFLLDLTRPLRPSSPSYPGDPSLQLSPIATLSQEGFVDEQLTMGMHLGTHIDAPAHMLETGARIASFPIEQFVGEAMVIDVHGIPLIEAHHLPLHQIKADMIVLLRTGMEEHYGHPAYFTDYPVLSEEAASALVKAKLKLLGIDAPSIDHAPYRAHKILLEAQICIVENLCNLAPLPKTPFTVIALPLPLDSNASPARVIACDYFFPKNMVK